MALFAKTALTANIANSSLRTGLRAFLLCLSFANLCFLRSWATMQDHVMDFFESSKPTWANLVALTLDVLLLGAMLWVPVILAVGSGRRGWIRALKWAILAGLAIPLNLIRTDPGFVRTSQEILAAIHGRLAFDVVAIALILLLLVRWEKIATRVAAVMLTIVLPALPVVVLVSARAIYTGPSGVLPDKPLLPALPQKPGAPHVIWMLFDEWDQNLTFDARAADLRLPELDRFRDQSLYASRAYPPSRETLVSVPSLLSGKRFTKSTPQGSSQLLETDDPRGPGERLTSESTIFGEARGAGFNVGVVGAYLPYGRLFGDFTARFLRAGENPHPSLASLMLAPARDEFLRLPLVARLGIAPKLDKVDQINYYLQARHDILQTVRDPRLNLLFVHLLLPHWPAIYDAAAGVLSTSRSTSYLGNIALLDHILGEVRQTLERAGAWDGTTILLTSDHPLRLALWLSRYREQGLPANVRQSDLVPFLLKMAGQKQGLAYNAPMQTVVTKDLLLAIMKGEITHPEQVTGWLDHNPLHQ